MGQASDGTRLNGNEFVTVGGGCFWCTEAIFSELKGVRKVESGYSGGNTPNPTYDQVCTDTTGHAEVVQVTFDPSEISLLDLLRVFFATHDPTTPSRQGADVGSQYRSVIFYRDSNQRKTAEEAIAEVNKSKLWGKTAVTQLEPFKAFYRAEDYHQNYFRDNPRQPYCQIVIAPKVVKFRNHYLTMLKK